MSREIAAIRRGWGWTGLDPEKIVAASPMGHCLVRDTAGTFHYLDPDLGRIEELGDEDAMVRHINKPENAILWRADNLVDAARERLGPCSGDEVYTLRLDAMVAGDYAPGNLIRLPLAELLSLSGDIARQVKDLPDGARVRLRIED